CAGRRPRALVKARTDSRAARWRFHARKEMGTAQSKHVSHGGDAARPRSAVRSDHLEKRIRPATRSNWNRRPTIRKSERTEREHGVCRWVAGRHSDEAGKDR